MLPEQKLDALVARHKAVESELASQLTPETYVKLSREFADFVERDFDLERVGEYPVRGFNDPIELFAYHG